MKAEFEIKIKTGSMYRFLMYHAYHKLSGLVGIALGAALLVLYAVLRESTENSWIYLLFGVLFLAYEPWSLYTRAVKQANLNPVFRKPLRYCVSDEGIRVTQQEASEEVPWEGVQKIRETRQSILVYTGARNAFIWVKAQMGGEEAKVRSLLKEHVDAGRCRLR